MPAKKPAQPMTPDLMAEVRNIYISLSPENLMWDGERPIREARAAARRLNARLKAIFKMVGREISESEAFGF